MKRGANEKAPHEAGPWGPIDSGSALAGRLLHPRRAPRAEPAATTFWPPCA